LSGTGSETIESFQQIRIYEDGRSLQHMSTYIPQWRTVAPVAYHRAVPQPQSRMTP
jgi:hypothetical protein